MHVKGNMEWGASLHVRGEEAPKSFASSLTFFLVFVFFVFGISKSVEVSWPLVVVMDSVLHSTHLHQKL